MSEDNVDERKPSYRDFPPTKETDKFRMWDPINLDIDTKQVPTDHTLKVHYDKNERFYETKVYSLPNGKTIKILSKINLDTEKINMIIKMERGTLIPPGNKSFTKEEFRMEVEKIEKDLSNHTDISKVTVSDCSEANKTAKKIVERQKESNSKNKKREIE